MNEMAHTSSSGAPRDEFPAFVEAVRAQLRAATAGDEILVYTNATGVYDAFLAELPEGLRPTYRCHACRRFVERFGGLSAVDASGRRAPALWRASLAPPGFQPAVAAMERAVQEAAIEGVFLSEEATWGLPENRDGKVPGKVWQHLSVTPAARLRHASSPLKSTEQRVAELAQEHAMLERLLAEHRPDTFRKARALLDGDALYRPEHARGPASFLDDLARQAASAKDARAREGLLWRAAATAPPGFAHARAGMLGTLLDDLAAEKPMAEIAATWKAKMDPLQYQRPQAAPAAGNLAQAERIVEKLGLAPALARRFARLSDIADAAWRRPEAKAAKPAEGGVFAHLTPKDGKAAKSPFDLPATTMTWVKLCATVLPKARHIELRVPSGRASWYAFVTAEDPAAPPILQWDHPDRRNPVSVFTYVGGTEAARWRLRAGTYAVVTAIALRPHQWFGGDFPHQGKSAFFLIEGARDTQYDRGALFFPEVLRGELHEVRATLEAYAKNGVLSGRDEATACGIEFAGQTFRVTHEDGSRREYTLDRWD